MVRSYPLTEDAPGLASETGVFVPSTNQRQRRAIIPAQAIGLGHRPSKESKG